MNAREEILGRVRAALEGAPPPPVVEPRSVVEPRAVVEQGAQRPISRDHSATDLVDLFAERVADYTATVHRCTADEVEAVLTELLGDRTTVVPPGFDRAVPHPVEDTGLTPTELDGIDAVVTMATLGIAETGTIVLTHGPGQGRRALSLVPDLHVCVVREDQVVPGVPDAVTALDPTRPQTWISGPSATSDIELDRVEGVHGPRTLRVVLVAGDA
ncbi:LutC/YkgG family protein [Nocardioides marmoribigeumensis]|uniref:L-lactate dehydrogenase complex protein LldG n=1 Tax=Nocardioides marmoribigeumensis TaxID=433649 RepID=A0ABU2BW41_9ACTN|nr:LUD domain-containing protein [Nocardioides marmoribigeumensis]MDR7362855.1 L-lactate dehydrogenase complex protein LldG [Nocardioides marmoribigeumensis]